MKKVIVITGTSTGLGLATAIQLAEQGNIVYATMRNLEKKGKLEDHANKKGLPIHISRMDVTDIESINSCIRLIIEEEGRIDVLINNAGAGFVRSTEQATLEEIDWVTEVNYKSVVYTTKAVIPFMRKEKSGHIINIGSVGGLVGQPFNELYCAAKFAVEGYTEAMASYLTPAFNIKFSVIEPGGISSDFADTVFKKVNETGGMRDDEYLPVLNNYLSTISERSAEGDTGVYQTPEQVAEVVVNCVKMENPPIRMRTSEWSENLCRLKTEADPSGLKLNKEIIDTMLHK